MENEFDFAELAESQQDLVDKVVERAHANVENPSQWTHEVVQMSDGSFSLCLRRETTGELWWEPISTEEVLELLNRSISWSNFSR